MTENRISELRAAVQTAKATYDEIHELEDLIAESRLEKALLLVEPKWDQFSKMMGRNELPLALCLAYRTGVISDPAEIAKGIEGAWVSAEFPQEILDEDDWSELFAFTGFIRDDQPGPRPTGAKTLFRGSSFELRTRWSWTEDIDQASWFADRIRSSGGDASLWEVTAPAVALLADFTSDFGRGEREWVVDTNGLDIRELGIRHRLTTGKQ